MLRERHVGYDATLHGRKQIAVAGVLFGLGNDALGLTGITVTKLDGSAKGGILLAIANKLKIPVRFIGIGEAAEDMQPFSAEDFVDALLASGATKK